MKRTETCRKVLLDFINQTEGWHKKVQLFVVAQEFSPETSGRQLRILAEEGKIQVSYYDGKYAKNLATYSRIGEQPKSNRPEIITKADGTRVAIINY